MALVTFMTSVVIEIVQFILSCGYSEVEDVIMNVAGGVIGYLIIKFIEKRKNEKRERVEN
jgi:glycopeptide antibiotics resistance protein